jgi:23S rRNA pseudouridine1911/1915/1917 synthase
VYGGRSRVPSAATARCLEILQEFQRQALHAARLSLRHPGSGERLEWRVEPPADMAELLKVLREDSEGVNG